MRSFFAIAISLWGAAHFYIGWRLVGTSRLRVRWMAAGWVGVMALMLLGPAGIFVRRIPAETSWTLGLEWASYLGMAFSAVLFPVVVLRDLGWLSGSTLDRVAALAHRIRRRRTDIGAAPPSVLPPDPDRRRFLMQSLNLGVVGFSGTVTGFGLYEARRRPEVVEVKVAIRRLPGEFDGFRIVQITDTHVGPTIRREMMEQYVALANDLDADLAALTGDLVDGYVSDMRRHVEPIGDLRAREGVFYVTGNHEYYWDAVGWIEEVRRLGLTVLVNEHRVIERGSARLVVAGVTDYSAGRYMPGERSNPASALRNAPEAAVRILLAHQPKSIYESSAAGYDLQISGHTHGGQLLPWGCLVSLLQPYVSGLHRHGNTWIYVSRGTGYWGPPVRVGAPSEITRITLTNDDRAP